jgi:hypothetical protein
MNSLQFQARICPLCYDDHQGECTMERLKASLDQYKHWLEEAESKLAKEQKS